MATGTVVTSGAKTKSLAGCCGSRKTTNCRRPSRISLVLSHWNSFLGECVDDGPISLHDIDITPPTSPTTTDLPPLPPPTLPPSPSQAAALPSRHAPPQEDEPAPDAASSVVVTASIHNQRAAPSPHDYPGDSGFEPNYYHQEDSGRYPQDYHDFQPDSYTRPVPRHHQQQQPQRQTQQQQRQYHHHQQQQHHHHQQQQQQRQYHHPQQYHPQPEQQQQYQEKPPPSSLPQNQQQQQQQPPSPQPPPYKTIQVQPEIHHHPIVASEPVIQTQPSTIQAPPDYQTTEPAPAPRPVSHSKTPLVKQSSQPTPESAYTIGDSFEPVLRRSHSVLDSEPVPQRSQEFIHSFQPVPQRSQPVPHSSEPAHQLSQPVTHSFDPVPQRSQPATHSSDPVPQRSQPVTHSPEPVPQRSQPVTHSSDPVPQRSQPVTHSSEPVPQRSQPVTHSSDPIPRRSQPINHSSEPVLQRSQRATHSSDPVPQRSQPATHSSESVPRRSQPINHPSEPVPQRSQPVTYPSEPVPQRTQPVIHQSEPVLQRSQPRNNSFQPVSQPNKPANQVSRHISEPKHQNHQQSPQTSKYIAPPFVQATPSSPLSTPPISPKMNNHSDTRVTNQMNGTPGLTNHVGGSTDSSTNHKKLSKLDSLDENKREGPIVIPADIESRSKNLTVDQVRDKISQAVSCLKSMDEYHHGDAMKVQKAVGDVYWDYSANRMENGDMLAQLGYADITITMLKQMNSLGIFKNDDIWFPTYYTYNTCWNYSDASEQLARSLAESGAVKLMTLNLGHKPYLDNMHSKNVYYVLKASLSTLHNIARCTGVKHHFKEIKTAEVIMPLISSNDEFLKSIAMLTLAYIVEEEENAKLIDDTNTIKNIVLWIHKALENKQKRRFRGFTPWELTQGLAKLAVNDGNKSKIVEEGALQDFLTMLRHTDPKEQATSAECIWNLSFDKNVRQTIIDFPDLVPALEELKDSENSAVKKNVNGALWMIKGDNDPSASVSRPSSSQAPKNHIFISYSWNEKELVQKIHASLQSQGYRIWVDWEQMGGSTLQAMAEAVENSAVVLVCMSERYKQSPNCRTEAEYTFQTRKDYIPLMMQRRYRPDGWLGAILGAKLFFDFSGKHPYEKALQGLIKELRGRGKHNNSYFDEPDGKRDPVASNASVSAVSLLGSTPTTPSGARPSNGGEGGACVAMSNENVETWLVSKGLQRFTPTFSQIDGQLIWQLKKMRETAPEYYHNSLERQFGMSLIDVLRFNAALDSLQ